MEGQVWEACMFAGRIATEICVNSALEAAEFLKKEGSWQR